LGKVIGRTICLDGDKVSICMNMSYFHVFYVSPYVPSKGICTWMSMCMRMCYMYFYHVFTLKSWLNGSMLLFWDYIHLGGFVSFPRDCC
jgi:hypothetical protein